MLVVVCGTLAFAVGLAAPELVRFLAAGLWLVLAAVGWLILFVAFGVIAMAGICRHLADGGR